MCIHDGFYESSVSALLRPVHRSSSCTTTSELPDSSPILSPTSLASTDADSSMENVEFVSLAKSDPSFLCLTQRIGEGASGEGWKGVFTTSLESSLVLDVVAKVGWPKDARKHFLKEAEIYDVLRKQDVNGVPLLIGLFDDVDDRVPILVTTYAGQEISSATVDDSLK
jgi:hypothetical protein